MRLKAPGFCLAAALAACSAAATAQDSGPTPSADELLVAATNAIQSESYRGIIINLQDGDLSVLQIFHRRQNGVEHQRLVALNGPAREIIRKGSKVTSVLPSKELVLISYQPREGALGRLSQVAVEQIKQSYNLKRGQVLRLAGRLSRVLRIIPKDKYRYGYRLALDRKTQLPLKLELVHNEQVLESLMFAQIQFEATMPDKLFESQFNLDGYRVIKHLAAEKTGKKANVSLWSASKLPPGFERVASGVRRVAEDVAIRQILFSDGLASVSAFIAPAGLRPPLNGSTSRGPVHAYGLTVGGKQVTVVGEVPAATVKLIATHLQRKSTG